MNIQQVITIVWGIVPVGVGIAMLIPFLYSIFTNCDSKFVFCCVSLFCLILGGVGLIINGVFKKRSKVLLPRSAFAIVTLSWLVAALLGALPYYYGGVFEKFIDCFFESMSGFTGTGATVLQDIEGVGKDILLWRSLTQFLGGMGVITFFVAVLPTLGVNGTHLFRAEASGPQKDKITPRVIDTARIYWIFLATFLFFVVFLLHICGFDSFNHAFTAVATGGFSTKNSGIAFFNNPAVEYVLAFTMILCSVNFGVYYSLIFGKLNKFFVDTELKAFFLVIVCSIFVLALLNWGNGYASFAESFRFSFFTVAATSSSSGFTNANYIEWCGASQIIIILLMLMGGMTGSTSGGIKCFRAVAAWRLIVKELKTFLHPNAVLTVRINHSAIRAEIATIIWAFLFLYFLAFIVLSIILVASGVHLMEVFPISISMLSNIGPAFGDYGPYGSYAMLPDIAKVVCSFSMLIGRLEFFTVLVIFTPSYWRK